jgi:hypothetical protein
MTFELSVVHGIKCTLVDPRPLKLNKQQHKHLAKVGAVPVLHSWSAEQLQQGCLTAQLLPLNRQQQQQLEQQQQQQAEQQQQTQHVAAPVGDQQHIVQQEHEQQPQQELVLHQVQGWFGPELWRSSGWQQLIGSSSSSSSSNGFSLVIGLHPDEATEPIVDYALEAGLPFAVMPCCVFSRLFPDRRLDSGGGQLVSVETYAQLVQYLMQKGGASQEVLGFVGANVVVFRRAPGYGDA